MIKKNFKKEINFNFGESDKNTNKAWNKDNQAWWDWYVTLADNSNSETKDVLLNCMVLKAVVLNQSLMDILSLVVQVTLKKHYLHLNLSCQPEKHTNPTKLDYLYPKPYFHS